MSNRYCIRGAIAALLLALGGTGAADLTAQTGTVTGVVTGAASGRPLNDAHVSLVGTEMQRMTDRQGRYQFDEVPPGTHTVQAGMLGFGTRTAEITVVAGSTTVADFQLEITAVTLKEIASICRPMIGAGLPAIGVGRFAEVVPLRGLSHALEGRIPGVRSVGTNGGVGAGRELLVRGTDSFGYTRQRPLVLVDGVRIDTNKDEWGAMEDVTCCYFSGGAGEDRLSDFNPEEIDRIEVLRGPAAAALYGAEGSAGVIRIFTMRGRTNTPPTFTLQTAVGVNRLRANLPTRLRPGVTGPDGFAALDPNEHLIEGGLISKLDLTVRGGGESATYFVAGGYTSEEGSVKPNDQTRANLRVNLNWRVADDLEVSVASGLARNRIWSLQSGNNWLGVYTNALLSDPRQATEEQPYGGGLFSGGWRGAAVADAKAIRTISDTDRWTGRVQLDYTPTPIFTNRLTLGVDDVSETKTRGLPQGRLYLGIGERGEKNQGWRKSRKYNLDFVSTYDYDGLFGMNSVSGSLSAGAQVYGDDLQMRMGTGRGFPEGVPLSIVNAVETFADDTTYEGSGRGVYLLNRLDLGDNFSVTAAVRVDEHSDFGDRVGAQVYPKANVAYRVPASTLPAPISDLRFRAAYGVAGKPPPPDRERKVYDYASGDSVIIPASQLEPENKHEFETGLDIGLLNDRIGVELTYYDARVLNALLEHARDYPVTHYSVENSAEIMNRGLEAAFAARLIDMPAFRWNMNLAYEWNENRIIDLGPDATDDSLATYRQRDDGTWEFVEWRSVTSKAGIYSGQSLDEVFYFGIAGYDSASNRHEWTTTWFSRGRARPAHMGSVFSNFQIGDLRLAFQLRGEMGAVMNNSDRSFGVRRRAYDEYLMHLDADGRPTYRADSVYDYHRFRAIDKRDHVRLQEVSLSYALPRGMAGRLGLQRTTVTLSGYNLHWWDDCNCQDPSAKYHAADTGDLANTAFLALPQPRRFVLSVRTRF